MRRVALTVCAVWVCVLAWSEAFALERAALALSGQDCDLAHEVIVETLERLDGVAKVEADLIPHHVLIDHDGRRTGAALAEVINNLPGASGRCRAAVMQSCITAGVDTRAAHSLPER